jgi:hypothetical protein
MTTDGIADRPDTECTLSGATQIKTTQRLSKSKYNDEFYTVIVEHFGDVRERLLDNLKYTLEPICFDNGVLMPFRVVSEVNKLTKQYGYESLVEWSELLSQEHTVYLSKNQALSLADEKNSELIESMVLECAKKVHNLFAMIVADNLGAIMSRKAFRNLKVTDHDSLREDVTKLLTIESKIQLRLNKFFSYEQWESHLNTEEN